MRNLFIVLALVSATSLACAQTPVPIEISYDAAGNRITRKVMQLPVKGLSSSEYYFDRMQTVEMKIHPNPTSGMIHVELLGDSKERVCSITIFDNSGRKTYAKTDKGSKVDVDLSAYPAGHYIVELYAGEEHTTWKIIKE